MRFDGETVTAPEDFCAVGSKVQEILDDGLDISSSFIDPVDLEALGLILELSLRVHTIHQFYCWTQGVLQNLLRHELLICALQKGEATALHVDSFSRTSTQSESVNALFVQDNFLVPPLIKAWQESYFEPVVLDVRNEASSAESGFARELNRLGANELLAHGTHDSSGKLVSFFVFACRSASNASRQLHLLKLLVPSLHAVWVHTQFVRPVTMESSRARSSERDLLTAREKDILVWIYRGKSNIEIGIILGLSPFTVKNHVQKILRRLNVFNRAQAVGKALALRILDGAAQG